MRFTLAPDITRVKSGSSGGQQTEVHLAEVDSIVESRQEYPPDSHYGTHQYVDGEEKEGESRKCTPGKEDKRLVP